MRNFIIPLLFVLFFGLSSCGTTYSVSSYSDGVVYSEPYPVQWVTVYNFDRIHWLYLNHPRFVWTNYHNHPYFIRYRRDCLQRNIYVRPYRENTIRRNYYNRTPIVRRNVGRSNLDYNRVRTQRYSNNNRTITPSRRTYDSNRTRIQRSTPSRNYNRSGTTRTINRSSSTTTRSRSSGTRTSNRSSSRRNN